MNGLALKLFARDWRSGALSLLLASLVIAISTMTSIGLFTDRIKHSIVDEASQVLAADAQVRGSVPPSPKWIEEAQNQGLATAMTTSMSVMAFFGENMKLSSVKAVSSSYPLKGALEVSSEPFGVGWPSSEGPKQGEVWVNSSLFSALDIEMGDQIDIGNAAFKVSSVLIKEPDVSMGALFSGTRILMHEGDLASTGAIQAGSRVRYHWLLSGSKKNLNTFKKWLQPELGIHSWWVGAEDSNNNLSSTIDRAQSFLLLAGCLSVILAGIAVALAARRYAFKQKKCVALLKTLGLPPKSISRLYITYLVLLGVMACCIGVSLGWLIHWGILYAIRDMLLTELQPASFKAYLGGAVAGCVALFAFAGPPLFSLRNTPPTIVIRDDIVQKKSVIFYNSLVGVLAILALVFWYSQSVVITFVLFLGLLICAMGVCGLAGIMVLLAKHLGRSLSGFWRLGFANIYRHRHYNILQILIFSILLTLLFILFLVKTSLIENWQKSMPNNAPNYFVYNIFSDEKDKVINFLNNNDITIKPFYPIVRGRISSVNGVEFKWMEGDPHQKNRYVRELGLTWSDDLGENNTLVKGLWWNDLKQSEGAVNEYVSIEKSFAEGMNLSVGDKITMSITGVEFVTEVASIRNVEWTSVNPNFFMVFRNPIMGGLSANWVTSFYAPKDKTVVINHLAKEYPTVTLLAVEQLLKQIMSIISQVTTAIEFILMLVLIAGFMVLVTGIQATLDERLKESAIIRTLGANRSLVNRSLLVEFCCLGLISGLLSTCASHLCLFILQIKVFSMPPEPSLLLLIMGPLLGVVLIGGVGWFSTRAVTLIPPVHVLKGLDSRS